MFFLESMFNETRIYIYSHPLCCDDGARGRMFAAWICIFAGTMKTIDTRRMLPYVSSFVRIDLTVEGALVGDA
jgi:hypothetical protein